MAQQVKRVSGSIPSSPIPHTEVHLGKILVAKLPPIHASEHECVCDRYKAFKDVK